MTIGIGVLCCTKPKNPTFRPGGKEVPRPDALIMMADTMGSTETDSTNDLHKMVIYSKEKIYAVCAGRIEMCAEIIELVRARIAAIAESGAPRTHGSLWRAITMAVNEHRQEHFNLDVLFPRHIILPEMKQEQHKILDEEWQDYEVNAHLLIGAFDDAGRAFLYFVGRVDGADGLVHPCLFPGFACIGSGARNASFWMKFRGQVMGCSVKQSAYHAYEAKVMAANAPTVNGDTEILIAISGEDPVYFSERLPAVKNCPVSLPELKSMFTRYGPQDTRIELGHPIPKAAKSKR